MIGNLQGVLLEKQAPILVIDVGGVGYEVQMPLNSFYLLPQIGEKISVFTHFIVREDGHFLFGFINKEQRALFRALIKVNGVGPKMALAILSALEPEIFARYVLNNDTSALVRIPGVGEKTAQRLIVEMRDKVTDWKSSDGTSIHDAVSALISLGYKQHEANKVLAQHRDKNLSSEELIRLALKEMK